MNNAELFNIPVLIWGKRNIFANKYIYLIQMVIYDHPFIFYLKILTIEGGLKTCK